MLTTAHPYCLEFDSGSNRQTHPEHLRIERVGKMFKQPYKSKKGYYPSPIQLNAKLINCCILGMFEKFYKPGTLQVQRITEKSWSRTLEDSEVSITVYGWDEDSREYLCSWNTSGKIRLPFHCVAVDWTGYKHLKEQFISYLNTLDG